MNDIFFGIDNKNNPLIIFCWCGKLYCDVVNGEVRVKAGAVQEIRVQAEIELTAPIVEDLELAKREVHFEPRLERETFRVWVENPEQRQQSMKAFHAM